MKKSDRSEEIVKEPVKATGLRTRASSSYSLIRKMISK